MKSDVTVFSSKEKNDNTKKQLNAFVFAPFSSGLFGFALFFTILLFTKLIAFWIGSMPKFDIDINDVILSGIGFVLMAVIKILENFQKN